jgi:hypothetical protein
MKSKTKQRKQTIEEFLKYKPRRLDFEWTIDEQQLVHITVPKFTSSIGKKFCSLLKKDQVLIADMDAIGSTVWLQMDGIKTVEDILNILKEKFPDQKNIDKRLFLFIQQMGQLHYLTY